MRDAMLAKKQQQEIQGDVAPAVEAETAAGAEINASPGDGIPAPAPDRPKRSPEEIQAQREAMLARRAQRGQGDAPEAAPKPTETVEATTAAGPDDLKMIEGIGPRIAALLNAAGITTFAQLAETEVSRLDQILREADLRSIADPGTWPEQAELAAAGNWEGFKRLTDELKGGRRGS